ncbi:MAG: NDP-sugar synthase [Thermofilaceae archaeon]
MLTAVILAGGKGTRLRPFTYHRPKPLMPVANKAVIDYILDIIEFSDVVDRVYVSLDYLGHMIAEHIRGEPRSVEVIPLVYSSIDTADSVRKLRHLLDDDFIVLMGDIITNCDLAAFWRFHKEKKGVASVVLKGVDNPCHYGLAFLSRNDKIELFMEKPRGYDLYLASLAVGPRARYTYTNLANAGIYAFSYSILDILDDNPHLLDFGRHVFPYLVEEGYPVYGWVSEPCYWIDVGTPPTYFQANVDLLDGLASPLRPAGVYSRGIWFSNPKSVEGVVRPPVVIGSEVRIERGSVVGPYAVLGNWAVVEEGAVIERSIIMDGAKVGYGARIYESIVGSRVEVGSETLLHKSIIEDLTRVPSSTNIFDHILVTEKRGAAIELRTRVG